MKPTAIPLNNDATDEHDLLARSSDCVLTLDRHGALVAINASGRKVFSGIKNLSEPLLGRSLLSLLGREEGDKPAQAFAALLAMFYREGGVMLRGTNSAGQPLALQWVAAAPVGDEVILLLKDASLSQPFRSELVALKEQLQVALFSVTDAVIVTDSEGRIETLNPTARSLLKVSAHSAVGVELCQLFTLFDGSSHRPLPCIVADALRRGRLSNSTENACLFVSGEAPVIISAVASPFRNSQRDVAGCVLVFRDASQNRRVSARMNWQATHDGLTQLPNREHFEAELAREVARAKVGAGGHGLLVIDIYQFRVINDTCGQGTGDALLVCLAEAFSKSLRSQDLLARIGSDEFGVLLRGATLAGTQRVAELLVQAAQQLDFSSEGRAIKVAICVGAMAIDIDTESEGQALAAATAACEAAKETGRNRIHLHSNLNSATVERRRNEMHWVSKITTALAEDRLVMYIQPVISVACPSDANHFEVLVRMREGDNIIAPGQFLPAAERYGLMDEIDRTVLLKVIDFIAQMPDSPHSFAVNISGTTISDDSFANFVLSEVQSSGIDASRLHFEITETAAVGNLRAALKLMNSLKALGCKFYLDDFGSGLSSFAYLKGLPVDYLKIDGSFVKAMTPGSIDFAMVSSINHLAKVMGLKTVAEFVENREVLTLLEEIGVDYAQGYYFAAPAPMLALLKP
ncbi:hypothetical protein R50072_04130 [Simiduia litorea]|uniref:putative bifunctional diguanylate cyclase/phosphodiesterase n=1 Tax=Simiduia litorea TaxID=1435348 RepID=UPI0036F2DC9E